MSSVAESFEDDWLNLLDLSAIADPGDKLAECEYFLGLAEQEPNRERFRWLVSAFFNAAYSFFETSALSAYVAFTDPRTDDPLEDSEALAILGKYVKVSQSAKNQYYVKTAKLHEITERLYELRKVNTHHLPLSIMAAGQSLPEGFHFGNMSGKGTPALSFCRSAMRLIQTVQLELDA